ncbi:hypothetical protein ISF_00975 [Cordyceps fumosorosea ARSEF 2679]|uniref:DNase1 protein n=1 Tax=Cordyceps fumosorosea (strain ARSEF 2679) TaxID=1081104 RepID=A0A162LQA9_CORFA|nr:hypothetical protein ISF_00975 [Cordyceps fumosorosea ARSEF 2679]OAA74074.1 hypothetical protein ISF_00975 [Cordyceps fumosorosea ARSEF 2679]
MHFSKTLLSLAASAAAVSAGTVTFWTLDDVQRTVYFTPSPGSPEIDPVTVSNAEKTTVTFPANYQGNFIAVEAGKPKADGMLGEVAFGGYGGMTYFDVSAIVVPSDTNNIKQMWPSGQATPMSGCEVFPCNNAYYLPDDVQTKVTNSVDLMTSLGSGSTGLF